jgi:26S proteasome regulatory subunit N5
MERREKTDFILKQVELCIEKGDWTQAGILARKISTRYFARKPKKTPEQIEKERIELEEKEKNRSVDDPPLEKPDDVTDLKLRYYEQQIHLAKHDDKYLDVCKHYRQVLDTESVEENPDQLRAVSTIFPPRYRPANTLQDSPTCHLLRPPGPVRQRTVRSSPPDTEG